MRELGIALMLLVLGASCTNRTVSVMKIDPIVEFELKEQVVQESDGRIPISIKLNRKSEKMVIIHYKLESPKDTLGGLFNKGGSISFPVGVQNGKFYLYLKNNKTREPEREIKVTLTEGKDVKLGLIKTHTIKVIDDD